MNKKTLSLTEDQYKAIIRAMRTGFTAASGKVFEPNNRIATALVLQSNIGLRIGDMLRLRLSDIVRDGGRYRFAILEKKTGKERTFTVPQIIYSYIADYTTDNGIAPTAKIFGGICERTVQKQLKIVCDHLGLVGIGTHSFRKTFATNIYNANGCDIELVRVLLQHSNTTVTQKYIGIQPQAVESALQNNINLL